ncbi:34992_t:CDS:2 [Gigaspora margarita]|uniref:34992_t:CDS:1 n=1 Tax=Gigaspora margarita TaxID=4874 RepID=A0ABN7XJ02_GIGMA|nr:34992_t:CDS:2 [Gigaspora margarita]
MVYSVHTEETDSIPSVIVAINPSNEEPIRTPTPEAPLVNPPDLALTDAANAINALAIALGQGTEKFLLKIDFFREDDLQDPITWIEEFRCAAKANK